MDSAAAELALILGALYLLDCFRWVARPARLVRRLPPFAAHLEAPMRVAAQFSRALAFGFPLPIERLFSVEGGCLRPLAEGLWVAEADLASWARPGRDAIVVPWAELTTLEVRGLELCRGPRVLHVFGARRAALAAAAELEALKVAGDGEARLRAAEVALAARLDGKALAERLERWGRLGPWLRMAALFLLGSIVAVLAAMLEGEVAWWRLLPLPLVAWPLAVAAAVAVVRRVLPPEVRPSRGQWALLFVSPLALIRAADLVEGELLADFEPVAAAAALLPPAEAARVVGEATRALAHPLVFDDGPHLDDGPLRAVVGRGVERAASAQGLSVPSSPQGRHCPRCFTEYQGALTRCASCSGVELVG